MTFRKLFTFALVSACLALPALAAATTGATHPAKVSFGLPRIPEHPSESDVTLTLEIQGCRAWGLSLSGRSLLIDYVAIHFHDGAALDSGDEPVEMLVSNNKDIFCDGRPGRTWYTIQLIAGGKKWPARKFTTKSGKKLDLIKIALGH
jgi:hypothetical protein